MVNLKNKKISSIKVIIISLLVSIFTYFITSYWKDNQIKSELEAKSSSYVCSYYTKRLNGYKYIKPLLFVDDDCESDGLLEIKQKLLGIIDKYKSVGDLSSASVYLRSYSNNEWTCINETEKFDPGSLFKVPVLIAALKMDELSPGFLIKTIPYSKKVDAGKNVAFKSKSIQLGQSYTVKELLTYMIKYSDNEATILLEQNLNPKVIQKLFSDVGLEVPNIFATQYQFTTKEYSYFMRAIYNAGYLTIKNSEFAGELLSQCEFNDGIVQGLPKSVKIAHKFGESGTEVEKQLHESALIYLDRKTYLLTIMTKGKDNKKLSQLLGEISQAVYVDMLNQEKAML